MWPNSSSGPVFPGDPYPMVSPPRRLRNLMKNIVALSPVVAFTEVLEVALRFGIGRLVSDQLVLGLPLHVGLAGQEKDFDGIRGGRRTSRQQDDDGDCRRPPGNRRIRMFS